MVLQREGEFEKSAEKKDIKCTRGESKHDMKGREKNSTEGHVWVRKKMIIIVKVREQH